MAGVAAMAGETSSVVTYGRRKRSAPENDRGDSACDNRQASPFPPPPSAPTLSGLPKSRQYFLDFGQFDFSCSTCKICGLLYARGHSEDERLHACFHKRYLRGVSFKGWQKERIVAEYEQDDGRIILVLPSDPLQHQIKVKELLKVMEKELGVEPGWLHHDQCKVYMYISLKKVVGFAVTESISKAYPVLSQSTPSDATKIFARSSDSQMDIRESLQLFPASNGLPPETGSCPPSLVTAKRCSLDSVEASQQTKRISELGKARDHGPRTLVFGGVKFQRERIYKQRCERDLATPAESPTLCIKSSVAAVCGIRGLWVSKPERRRGIATKLIDAVRFSFIYGLVLDVSQCAFSQPTPDGKAFAAKYSKTGSYLVYSS